MKPEHVLALNPWRQKKIININCNILKYLIYLNCFQLHQTCFLIPFSGHCIPRYWGKVILFHFHFKNKTTSSNAPLTADEPLGVLESNFSTFTSLRPRAGALRVSCFMCSPRHKQNKTFTTTAVIKRKKLLFFVLLLGRCFLPPLRPPHRTNFTSATNEMHKIYGTIRCSTTLYGNNKLFCLSG